MNFWKSNPVQKKALDFTLLKLSIQTPLVPSGCISCWLLSHATFLQFFLIHYRSKQPIREANSRWDNAWGNNQDGTHHFHSFHCHNAVTSPLGTKFQTKAMIVPVMLGYLADTRLASVGVMVQTTSLMKFFTPSITPCSIGKTEKQQMGQNNFLPVYWSYWEIATEVGSRRAFPLQAFSLMPMCSAEASVPKALSSLHSLLLKGKDRNPSLSWFTVWNQ